MRHEIRISHSPRQHYFFLTVRRHSSRTGPPWTGRLLTHDIIDDHEHDDFRTRCNHLCPGMLINRNRGTLCMDKTEFAAFHPVSARCVLELRSQETLEWLFVLVRRNTWGGGVIGLTSQ